MAITFSTDRLQGLEGTTIAGVYARIQSVTVKKYDAYSETDQLGNTTNHAASWKCLYGVVLHGSAAKRNAAGEYPEWRNRLNSRSIEHFVGVYDPTSSDSPYTQSYNNLKSRLAADDPPIATNISDA
tara:strand:+ start:136 stop:516 length:381 start_codon:yes stop_codon:yes gene_type:complete